MSGAGSGSGQAAPSLLDAALGSAPAADSAAPGRTTGAWLLALATHAVVLGLALQAEPSLENWAARMAALIHEDLAADAPVVIEAEPVSLRPPPPPPPEPETSAAPEPEAPAPEPPPVAESPPPAAEPAPPAPAQSAAVLAAEPTPDAPLDFTDNTFVTGSAETYAGGVSAAAGTSTSAVADRSARVPPPRQRRRSRARGIQLGGEEWDCAWPEQAVSADIFEQHVSLKVSVSAAGAVTSVQILLDPGLGFGPAAEACARRMRFLPARNDDGQPIDAVSPPIRVRFTR